MKQSKIIVITGSIATGKSAATNILRKRGFTVVDADKIGHEVLLYPKIIDEIAEKFGKEYIENGFVNRARLSKYVFENNRLEDLNKIMHEAIFQKIKAEIEAVKDKIVFVDMPLYFELEGKLEQYDFRADEVWLVFVNENIQLQRLMQRDEISKTEAIKKISSQIGIEEKKQKATKILFNESTVEELEEQIDTLLKAEE